MDINFKKWLQDNESILSEPVKGLFSDSIKCYYNDIDRPAYLLAYQGMLWYLREVIVASKAPEGYKEGEWADIKSKVTNDLHWDEETYNWIRKYANTQQNKAAVIAMADETRRKFEYWRDIRNVCAHYKEYHFLKAHTLTLYSFIEQYLLTFAVEGSAETLAREFNDYYNPELTEEDTPIEPLILKIPKMVQISEVPVFANKVNSSFYIDFCNEGYYKLLHRISELLPQNYVGAFFDDLHKFKPSYYAYLQKYPDSVTKLLIDKKEIKSFWQTKLPSYSDGYALLVNMLESDMIKESDVESAIKSFLQGMMKRDESFRCGDGHILSSLKRFGFFEIFKKEYWNKEYLCGYYERARNICYKTNFFVSMLWQIGIDRDAIVPVLDMFTSDTRPFTLCKRFLDEFKTDETYWKKFTEVMKNNNLSMPERLEKNIE